MPTDLIEDIETMLRSEPQNDPADVSDVIREMTNAINSVDALLTDVHRMRRVDEGETGRDAFERAAAAYDIMDRLKPIHDELRRLISAMSGQGQRCNIALTSIADTFGLVHAPHLAEQNSHPPFDDVPF